MTAGLSVMRTVCAVVSAGLMAASCSSGTPDGHTAAADTPAPASPVPAPPDFTHIAGEYPNPAQVDSTRDSPAPVGACVNVGGSQAHSTLTVVPCNAPTSAFRIIQHADTPDQCGDTDLHYYQNGPAGQWSACLDYNWNANACISIGSWKVTSTTCDDRAVAPLYRPWSVVTNTIDTQQCGYGQKGFIHPARRFTICVAQVA